MSASILASMLSVKRGRGKPNATGREQRFRPAWSRIRLARAALFHAVILFDKVRSLYIVYIKIEMQDKKKSNFF